MLDWVMLGRLFRGRRNTDAEVRKRMHSALQHHQAQQWPEAEAGYRHVLALDPQNVDALNFLGVVAHRRGWHDLAVARYMKVLEIAPRHVDAHLNLADAYLAKGEPLAAIAFYRKALQLKPDIPLAHCNLGNALMRLGRLEEAAECFRTALQFHPSLVEAHYNLGIAYRDLARRAEAITCFRKVLELRPGFAEAHYCLGHVLCDEDQLPEALGEFRAALASRPDYAEARWSITMSQLPAVYGAGDDPKRARSAFAADLKELERWFDEDDARVLSGAEAVGAAQPFALAYQEESNRDLLQRHGALCVRLMTEWHHAQTPPARRRHATHEVVRVGIVSGHFREHSVWNAIVKGWFQQLDLNRFSLHAFYLGVGEDDETRYARSRAAHFEQGPKGLRQWVEAILEQEPDVLLYPEIGMDPMTLRLASLRLAPVQAATWGHPETTGLPTMDYYLSAEDLEPPDAQANYAEQLVALPHLGCFLQPRGMQAILPDLANCGIDPDSPVLLCPGVPFKYAPRHDRVFVEIARRLGNCRFVFFTHWNRRLSERLRERIEAVFSENALDAGDFVAFIPWQGKQAFCGWLRQSDVFLDTIGFSGFNTALLALECGLPIVTRESRFLRGRLASGLLKRAGLPELVADSEDEYVALAVRLVQDAAYNERICAQLDANRSRLFADRAPIRALEEFLTSAARKP